MLSGLLPVAETLEWRIIHMILFPAQVHKEIHRVVPATDHIL